MRCAEDRRQVVLGARCRAYSHPSLLSPRVVYNWVRRNVGVNVVVHVHHITGRTQMAQATYEEELSRVLTGSSFV